MPTAVAYLRVLSEVSQSDDATSVRGGSRLVGNPYLHTGDLDTRRQVGQCRHRLVVTLSEIVRQEEVAVLLIVSHVHLEGCGVRTSLRGHALRRRFLLREYRLQFQPAELHIRADTEEARSALHQRVVRGEGNVSCLHEFDDLIFLAVVFQLQVLRIEVEGGVGVVVQVHVHLVTHLAVHVQVDLLVEVEGCGLPVTDRQRGIVDAFEVDTHLQLCRSLSLDAHPTRAEDLLCWSQVKVHVGKRELLLPFVLHVLGILLPEEVAQQPFLAPFPVFLWRHQHWGIQIRTVHLRADVVHIGRIVVFHSLADIVGTSQVECRRVEILHDHRNRRLNAPARLQRVRLLRLRTHARDQQAHQYPNNPPGSHLICLRASFTTVSTGASGCSCKMASTTFCEGAGANPSIVSADTASSFT